MVVGNCGTKKYEELPFFAGGSFLAGAKTRHSARGGRSGGAKVAGGIRAAAGAGAERSLLGGTGASASVLVGF